LLRCLGASLFACAIAASVACGTGKGPAGGTADDGGPGPGDTDNSFPLDAGDRWRYLGPDGGLRTPPAVEYARVTGTKMVGNVSATVLTTTSGVPDGGSLETYLVKDDHGVLVMGSGDASDVITPQIAPYYALRFPLLPGPAFTSVDASGLDYGRDLDEDGKHETVSIHATVRVLALEDVAGLLGTPRCAHVQTNTVATLLYSRTKTSQSTLLVEDLWLAPGVGTVKRQFGGPYVLPASESLLGYVVGGVRHGAYDDILALPRLDPVADSDTNIYPAAVWNGAEYVVAASLPSSSSKAKATELAFFDAGGTRLRSAEVPPGDAPSLSWNGSAFLLAHGGQSGVAAQRLDANGGLVGAPIQLGTDSFFSSVASDGQLWLVVWGEYVGGNSGYDVHGAIVAADGSTPGQFVIASGPGPQNLPRAVFDGKNYLVTWSSQVNDVDANTHLFAARISPGGTILDPTGIPLAIGPGPKGPPQLASNGAGAFAVWTDAAGARFTRIGQDGALLDGPPGGGGAPLGLPAADAVAFDGRDYRIVWTALAYSSTDGIYTARVSQDGVVRDPGGALIAPAATTSFQVSGIVANAALACSGPGSALVPWLQIVSDKSIAAVLVEPP